MRLISVKLAIVLAAFAGLVVGVIISGSFASDIARASSQILGFGSGREVEGRLSFPRNQFDRRVLGTPQGLLDTAESLISANFQRVVNIPGERVRRLAKGVGQLRIQISGSDEFATCSGFLISKQFVLTAAHCLTGIESGNSARGMQSSRATRPRIEKMSIVFSYLDADVKYQGIALELEAEPAEFDAKYSVDLDYVVLKLVERPAPQLGEFDRALREGVDIQILPLGDVPFVAKHGFFMLHYPRGEPLTLTSNYCKAIDLDPPFIDNDYEFHHTCDTVPGSSGAPIFSEDHDAVIGMHICCAFVGAQGGGSRSNIGVSLAQIAKHSAIVKSLIRANQLTLRERLWVARSESLAAQSDLARAEEDYPLAVRLARAALEPLLRPTKESEQDRALRAMQLKDAEQRLLPAAFKAQGALMRAVSESPQLRLLAGHTDAVNTAVFSPDGKFIVTASDDHTTRIWSLQGDAPVVMLKGAKIAALSPDGSLIASSLSDTAMGPDTNMQLWDSRTGSKIRALDGPGSRVVSSLEFSPGGDRVVSAGYDGTRVWDVKTGRQRAFLPMVREDSEEPLATFSVDGKLAVSGWSDHKVSVFSGTNFGATKVIGGDHGSIGAIRFSPDGLQLAVAGDDGLVRIWSVETSQIENTLTGHEGPVKSVAYSVDGERIATSSIDGTARIWDRRSGVQLKIFRGHSGPVRSVAFNRDGSQLVTAGGSFGTGDNTARVWDARVTAAVSANKLRISPDEIKTALAGFFATPWAFPFLRAAISPDGSLIATTSGEFYTPQEGDKSVRLWDALTGKQVSIFKISQDTTGEAEGRQGADHPMFSADGKRLAVLCGQSCAVPYRLWDLAAGTELTQPLTGDGQYSFPHTAALSKDGMELAVGGEGGVVIVFDLRNFRVLRSLQPHVGDVEAIAFSAEGGRIATGSTDFTAQIWNVSGAPGLIPLRGHTGTVNAVAFSPDGATVVTGSEDRTLRIWDAKTGAELSTMRGHRGGVSSVAFSHDGSRIVTAGAENMVRVWDVAGGVELASFRGHRGNINRASFSEDDKHIVSIGQDKTVRIWALPRKLAARGVELIEAAKVFGVLDQGECDSFPDACHDP